MNSHLGAAADEHCGPRKKVTWWPLLMGKRHEPPPPRTLISFLFTSFQLEGGARNKLLSRRPPAGRADLLNGFRLSGQPLDPFVQFLPEPSAATSGRCFTNVHPQPVCDYPFSSLLTRARPGADTAQAEKWKASLIRLRQSKNGNCSENNKKKKPTASVGTPRCKIK